MAQAVDPDSGFVPGDPMELFGTGGDLAIQRGGGLGNDKGPARGYDLEKSFVELTAGFSQQAAVNDQSFFLRKAAPPPVTLGLGLELAMTTRQIPEFNTATVQGGVLPWWLQGSRVT